MAEKWIHSMNGVPWTNVKMNDAIQILRPNASVTFAFGAEALSVLKDLNEIVFQVRPDLILHVWSVADNRIITNEELSLLTKMGNVKKLYFNGFNNTSLKEVAEMEQLTSLRLEPKKKLDLSFIEKLTQLSNISLTGKFMALEPLSSCNKLTNLHLSTTINSFSFFKTLNNIRHLSIDNCITSSDFNHINRETLINLSITSIKMLENVDFLADFQNLQSLRLGATRVKTLPSLAKLTKLKKLEFDCMKVWENPEILQTLPMLEELLLKEINTKLKAEQFYFLTAMDTLTSLDYRFMDFNKSRIEKLNNWFKEKSKEYILKNNNT
ncbi:hypothetical protein [Sphingobacterium kitahiroshimense]|uniref:Internalin A n=1 Tax=Sphingobacterium kitahiroshimense TaxID=470446 RepID=A0ABV0BVP9_9SPHI